MNFLRGDAHKIYLRLKRDPKTIKESKYLRDIQEIRAFYQSIDSDILKLIYYRLVKENNGSGMIPIYVSSIPFLFLIFSQNLQSILFVEGSRNWMIFIIIYILGITFSLFMHFREKAWAASHIEIIQDILKERNDT
ncbi:MULTISPECIES: hypothetical protein [Lysinibacillus]|uniref:Uncharacterized protein n=1 Tax=Lysinibacillus antri TaxID=2498145 RepID=A0A432LD48_9BACI|nr:MULTISPECIES: hypothetical protein [Lysinibacillus]RUL53548.1 hypothetical protein EK386_08240 [Lysinibacillus antri]TSI06219.1 hypothetical protein FJQ64_10850 [Lysinibacillus sp. BW-2-10]